VLHVLRYPISSVELLFRPLHKAKVGAVLLGSWLFLPLLSPLALVAIPAFLERFWSSDPNLWSFQYHYSMLVAPILAFAAIDTVARVRHYVPARWASISTASLSVGVLAATVALVAVIQPLAELETYVSTARAAQIQSCLEVIPPDASVAATSRVLPHLSERRQIYTVPAGIKSQYLAIDLSTNGTLSAAYAQYLRDLLKTSLASGYSVACSKGQTAVLVHGNAQGTLSPQMASFIRG
jgi:uncharacterized membrane protein